MITLKPLALSLTLLGALAAYPCFAEVPQKAPEIATAYAEKSGWAAQKFMVAAANPLAADAGYQMLKRGGSAIDAAIATQLVLTLVEPQSSGIGGGAFLLYSTAKGVQAFDGRETAPASADEHLFQNADGSPVSRATGVVADVPWVRRVCCACWNWRTRNTASCRGRPCSAPPSNWRTAAFPSASASTAC
jgi:gamma-glutamyltranspeptidase/glutathione hydrolase